MKVFSKAVQLVWLITLLVAFSDGETVLNDHSGMNGSISYSLDPVGNRLSDVSTLGPVSSTSTTCNPDDQSQAETYDSTGDTTATGGKSYAFNPN